MWFLCATSVRTSFVYGRPSLPSACVSPFLCSRLVTGGARRSQSNESLIVLSDVREVGLIFACFLHSANDERSTANIAKGGARRLLNEVFFLKSLIQAIQRSCNSQLD